MHLGPFAGAGPRVNRSNLPRLWHGLSIIPSFTVFLRSLKIFKNVGSRSSSEMESDQYLFRAYSPKINMPMRNSSKSFLMVNFKKQLSVSALQLIICRNSSPILPCTHRRRGELKKIELKVKKMKKQKTNKYSKLNQRIEL